MQRIMTISALALLLLVAAAGGSFAQSSARIEAEKQFVEAQKALARGDDKTAENHLTRALKLDSDFTSAIWQLSQIYEKRGQLEYARELIIRGLQQEPDASWARDKLAQLERVLAGKLMNQAESYMKSGRYDLALPKLSLYVGIKPDDPAPLLKMGRCHLALGNLDAAREYLTQAVQRDPSNSEITTLLDDVDRRIARSEVDSLVETAKNILAGSALDRAERAKAALNAVLEKDPDNAWAGEKLSELVAAEKPPVKKAAEQVAAQEPVNKEPPDASSPGSRAGHLFVNGILVLVAFALFAAAVMLALDMRKKTSVKSYPLQGTISLIPVLDIVSLLNANLKSGRLSITGGKSRGEVFFEKGEIVHARFAGIDGKKAFHRIMALKSGRYVFYNHLPNVKHTISEPLSLLLLSMKSLEESSRAGASRSPERGTPVNV